MTLVSYEKDHPQSDSQPKETWFLKINNGQGNSFAQTSAIGDMADSESIMTQVVNNDLSLSESANSVTAFHAAYPDTSSPNSINPVCAVFEKIQSEIAIKCHGVKAYSEDWTELSATDLSALKAGDKVRFSVSGSSSSGNFDKAQFTINGTARAEVQSKKPGSEEFYDEFTIPAGVQSFNVTAKVHHAGTDKWI